MPRETKYRAWSPIHNRMFGVKTVYFNEDGVGISQIDYVYDGKTEFDTHKPACGYPYNQVKLMQYINVKDIDDKEIYESDVVRVFYPGEEIHSVGVVEWDEHRTGFAPMTVPADYEEIYAYRFQIIGNIYETKDYKKLLN